MARQSALVIPLLNSVPTDRFPKRQFPKGSFVKQPGNETESVYLIESGKVAAFFMGPQGQDVPFPELEVGDFVGDPFASASYEPASYFQAKEDTTVLVMSQGQLLETLRHSPGFAEFVTKAVMSSLRTTRRLYLENRLLPMRTRLYSELLRLGIRDGRGLLRISPMPTHAELARRIASQRETVTKQMSHLANLGAVDNTDGTVTIANEEYLRVEIRKFLGSIDI